MRRRWRLGGGGGAGIWSGGDDGPTTKPAAAAPGGVVIRVLISGAHASFLHMRVFPSTTAGQV